MKKRTEVWLKKIAIGIFLVEAVIFTSLALSYQTPLIPHTVLNQKENEWLGMLIYVVEVPLVGERHASDQELDAISDRLLGSPPPERSWVFFYLPGVVPDDWEYLTPHYLPERDGVAIVPFSHYRTGYDHVDNSW